MLSNIVGVQVWSAILIMIGAAVLALELKPRRVTRLPLRSGHDATRASDRADRVGLTLFGLLVWLGPSRRPNGS